MALNPLVSLIGRLVARSGRKRGNRQTDSQTDRQTDRQTDGQNDKTTTLTLAAHARQGLVRLLIWMTMCIENLIIIYTVSDEVCGHRKLWLAYINGGTFENFVPGTRFSGHLAFAPCYTIDVTCSSK